MAHFPCDRLISISRKKTYLHHNSWTEKKQKTIKKLLALQSGNFHWNQETYSSLCSRPVVGPQIFQGEG